MAIQVYLRLKPDNIDLDQPLNNENFDDKTITFHSNVGMGKLNSLPEETFKFNKIFNVDSTQKDVASFCVPSIENDLINGINCSLITYGSKHTGKTFTLFGEHGIHSGLVPRLLTKLFHLKSNTDDSNIDHTVSFKISALDLLHECTAVKDPLSKNDRYLTLCNDQADDSYDGVWSDDVNWIYCETLEHLLALIQQISNNSKGDTIIRLELTQMFIPSNLIIKSNLVLVDLKSFEDRSKLHENFVDMLMGKNCSQNAVNNLNKLLYGPIFKNFNTRIISTCSLWPVLQNETLQTLKVTRYLSNVVKDYSIPNKKWIAAITKFENLSIVNEVKTENYNKQIELLKSTIDQLETKNIDHIKNKRQEIERLTLDNSSLGIEWKNLLLKNNERVNTRIDKTENEQLEIIVDKINTLFSHKLQLDTHSNNNKQLCNEKDNERRIKTELDIINSKLLDVINQQEKKIQSYLHENMIYKKKLDQLKTFYLNNNERIIELEDEVLKNNQEPQHFRRSHGTIVSSPITGDLQFSSFRNPSWVMSSTASLTPTVSTSSVLSFESSSTTPHSSTNTRNNDYLSQSGFNLQIIKPK